MEQLQLHDAVVFLVAAGLLIPAAKHFSLSPILGFLLIGLAIGPFGLNRWVDDFSWIDHLMITDIDGVHALAELGIVFLLFMIGLELSWERLWGMRRLVFGMGTAQILLTGSAIGAIAWLFGNSLQASVILGSCLALSSTAVVMQLLVEHQQLGTAVGRGSFAVLLAQDIAVVPILFIVSSFGADQDGPVFVNLMLAFGQAVGAVALILGLGRLIVRPILRFVGNAGSPEFFMAATLLMIIATASATHAAGLSAALGAFLAGLLLAESEYRHEIEVNIAPFKGLLLGLFFMSIGMTIDLAEIVKNPLFVTLSILGLILVKATLTGGIAFLFGHSRSNAIAMGLLLSQGGEFAFVVVALATSLALLPESTAQFMLIVVGATMFLTPIINRCSEAVASVLRKTDLPPSRELLEESLELANNLGGHVVIVGFGRTGQLLASLLKKQQVPYVALDLNSERVTELKLLGLPIHYGDASRAALLEKTRLNSAAVLAICTDDSGATQRVLAAAKRVAPKTPIIARARDLEHGKVLLDAGASQVVPELIESGLQMSQLMLEILGYPQHAARELITHRRSEIEKN